jgi:hypothetical protein
MNHACDDFVQKKLKAGPGLIKILKQQKSFPHNDFLVNHEHYSKIVEMIFIMSDNLTLKNY